jgi:GGDEF domain-containing protein
VARAIQDSALEVGGSRVFVGHLGGDDFVLVSPVELSEPLCVAIIEAIGKVIGGLYEQEDRDRGYIELENRQGKMERFPLLSVSIGVATTDRRPFSHPGEVVSVATELKEFAKRTEGSKFVFDRRTYGDASPTPEP